VGSRVCANCPIQYYSSLFNSEDCSECQLGQYQQAVGMSTCLPKRQDSNIIVLMSATDPTEVVGVEEVRCPPVGMDCTGPSPRYTGYVWHDPSIRLPNCTTFVPDGSNGTTGSVDDGSFTPVCTNMYTCPLKGCPDSGTKMECKEGYHGPLCAMCTVGHFLRVRECVKCEAPMWGWFALCLLAAALTVLLALRTFGRYLNASATQKVFARFKILVSFVTVIVTVETQFGVIWPSAFSRALDGFAVLALDFGITASMFCIMDMSFYQNLLGLTAFLALLVAAVLGRAYCLCSRKQRPGVNQDAKAAVRVWRQGVFVAVYLAVFFYPLVSVKVIEVFSCHDVEGVFYLRADYSQRCAGSRWVSMAAYAGVWLVLYVILFPLCIAYKLWSYRQKPKATDDNFKARRSQMLSSATRLLESIDFDVHFLLQDYKNVGVCFMWEAFEMLRKVSLSIVGSFWSTKSIMCVGTALLISVFFLCTHCWHLPYTDRDCNLLQLLCLTVTSLIYFCGVLLEARSVEKNDRESLGELMVTLLLIVLIMIVGSVFLVLFWFRQWARNVRYAKAAIEKSADYNASLQAHPIDSKQLEVGQVLGKGASALVRVGKYMGNDVALKIEVVSRFPMELPIEEKLQTAQAEAQLLMPLRHPNVVTLYGISIVHQADDIQVQSINSMHQADDIQVQSINSMHQVDDIQVLVIW
jgi:hypothetical protein